MTIDLQDLLSLSPETATEAADPAPEAPYIGPARVLAVEGMRTTVSIRGVRMSALLALGYRYEPAPGDLLLVATQRENAYVIGVLAGSGRTVLDAPGDLALRAPRGEISLLSGRGVRMQAPRISLTAEKLETTARRVVENLGSLRQRIAEELDVCADTVRTRARTLFRVRGGRIVQKADEDVKIDGRQVRLG